MNTRNLRIVLIAILLAAMSSAAVSPQLMHAASGPPLYPVTPRIVNLSDVTATILWFTPGDSTTGTINYGTSCGTGLSSQATQNETSNSVIHETDLFPLAAGTVYFFNVVSGGTTDDNGGKCYTFTTVGQSGSPPLPPPYPVLVLGKVKTGQNCSAGATSAVVTVTDTRTGVTAVANAADVLPASDPSTGAVAGNFGVPFRPAASAVSPASPEDYFQSASGDTIVINAHDGQFVASTSITWDGSSGPISLPSGALCLQAGVPDAPSITDATHGDASIGLTWSRPVFDGGALLDGYRATCIDGTNTGAPPIAQTVGDGAATSGTITSLTNGDSYTCTLQAHNASGYGAASAPSNPVTPSGTAPNAPTLNSATGGNNKITLTWSPPSPASSTTIDHFTGVCTDGANHQFQSTFQGATTMSGDVTGLTNDTSYTCYVTAHDSVGDSSASGTKSATPSTIPGAPAGLKATAGNTSVTLTWTQDNGGSPILSWPTLTVQLDGGKPLPSSTKPKFSGPVCDSATPANCMTNVSGSTTGTGLVNGTKYLFTIGAHNANGDGPTAQQTGVPNAPPTITSSLKSPNVTLTYNGKLTPFTITASDAAEKENVVVTPVLGSGQHPCLLPNGSMGGVLSCAGIPSGLTFTAKSEGKGTTSVTISGTVALPQGTFTLAVSADDGHAGPVIQQIAVFNVTPAGVSIAAASSNTEFVSPGGKSLSLQATPSAGGTAHPSALNVTLTPASGGTALVCPGSAGAKNLYRFNCSANPPPTGVYQVVYSVNNGYWKGTSVAQALAITDGTFEAGGGTVRNGKNAADFAFLAAKDCSSGTLLYIQHEKNDVVLKSSGPITNCSAVPQGAKTPPSFSFKGTGTANGKSGYSFLFTATGTPTGVTKPPAPSIALTTTLNKKPFPDLTFKPLTAPVGSITII